MTDTTTREVDQKLEEYSNIIDNEIANQLLEGHHYVVMETLVDGQVCFILAEAVQNGLKYDHKRLDHFCVGNDRGVDAVRERLTSLAKEGTINIETDEGITYYRYKDVTLGLMKIIRDTYAAYWTSIPTRSVDLTKEMKEIKKRREELKRRQELYTKFMPFVIGMGVVFGLTLLCAIYRLVTG